MSNVNLFGKEWSDIVFDGRNKLYGGYKLREESSKNTLLALVIGIGSLTSVFMMSYLYSSSNIIEMPVPDTGSVDPTVLVVDFGDKDVVQPIVEPKTASKTDDAVGATTNVQELKAFTNITAAQDHLVKSNLAAQKEFNDQITSGQTSSEADLVNGNLKSGGENTGVNIGGNNNSNVTTLSTGETNLKGNEIVKFVQVKASPVGGFDKFYEGFVRKFQAPVLANSTNEIVVRLRFVVEKDGSFTDVKVLNDTYGVGNEAIRVLKQMPKWQPAKHNDQTVRSMFTLPIKIKVNN